ncbi:MAG: hypothetical protein ACFFB5_23675 [Promethearchaeota archaeon]
MNEEMKKMSSGSQFYLKGTGIGILMFWLVIILSFLIDIRSLELIFRQAPALFLLILILPFFLILMYFQTPNGVPSILLLSWEAVWMLGLIVSHTKIIEKKTVWKNTILFLLILIGAAPFLVVQIVGVEFIPLVSTLINEAAVHYSFVYPPAKFIQIYWGVPLWIITWYYAWTLKIPQNLVSKKSLEATQLQWLTWLITLSGILIVNPVLTIIYFP